MNNLIPTAFLLDLDDTILNFDGFSNACWEQLCQMIAPQLDDVTADQLLTAITAVRTWYWADPIRHRRGRLDMVASRREIVSLAFERLGVFEPHLSQRMADAYTEQREEWVHPFEGAVESLQHFQEQGIRMGLITNGSTAFQRRKIERFQLARFFDVILIEGEFGVGKPDHRIFQSALKALQASASQTWMIGNDLEFDIRPAQELGLQTAWIDQKRTGVPGGRDLIPTRILFMLADLCQAPWL